MKKTTLNNAAAPVILTPFLPDLSHGDCCLGLLCERVFLPAYLQFDLVVAVFNKGSNQTETAAHASRCLMRTLSGREIQDMNGEAAWYGAMLALLAMGAIFGIVLFAQP